MYSDDIFLFILRDKTGFWFQIQIYLQGHKLILNHHNWKSLTTEQIGCD